MNGRDVSDKEETESLFAENKKAVTLLISRYLSIDDYFENSDDMYSDNELWNDDSDEKRLLMDSVNATSATTPPSAVPTKESVSPKRQPPPTPREKAATPCNSHPTDFSIAHDPLHHTKVKAHLESVNNEIQLLDQRMEQLMMNKKMNETTQELYQDPVDSRPTIPRSNSMVERFSHAKVATHQIVDSETEHIYETIPEYSETEPIYCSPHESHADLRRAQQQQYQQQSQPQPVMRWSKSFSAKDRTRPSSAKVPQKQRLSGSGGDDNNHCDNNKNQFSSSPFNTTDSGNSNSNNNNKFLTLEFCPNERAQCQGSTLVLCAPAGKSGGGSNHRRGDSAMVIDRNAGGGGGRREKNEFERVVVATGGKAATTRQSGRMGRIPNSVSNGHLQPQAVGEDERLSKGCSASHTLPGGGGVGGDTMYTNAANLEQTITLQQELFRQSMLKQRMGQGNKAQAMPNPATGGQRQLRGKEAEHSRGRRKVPVDEKVSNYKS